MMVSNSFMASLPCPCPCIISSKACMLGTSNSVTIVQYRSAQRSVMMRILPCPSFSLSFAMARDFSTIGRTLPGLQYMISRISNMVSPEVAGLPVVDRTAFSISDCGTRGAAIVMEVRRSDVGRLRADQPSVAQLFQAVCRPAEDASDGERRSEQFGRKSQTVQQQRRVELDIGLEPPFWLAFTEQTQRGDFDLPRKVIEKLIAAARIEAFGSSGKHIRTRVTHAVDAMSESHETLAPIEFGADDTFRPFGSTDFEHHIQRRTRCAAMQWTLECADGAGDRGNDIGSRGDDNPCRKCGGVETVIAHGVEIGF